MRIIYIYNILMYIISLTFYYMSYVEQLVYAAYDRDQFRKNKHK